MTTHTSPDLPPLTPDEQAAADMLRRPSANSPSPKADIPASMTFEAPESFKKAKALKKKKIKVPRDPVLHVNVPNLKKRQKEADTSVPLDRLPEHLVKLTIEEKAAFTRCLAWGAPRLELRIVPNATKQQATAGQALTVSVRDRLIAEDLVINASALRLRSDIKDINYLDVMAHIQAMSMACAVTAYDRNELKPFTADLDKAPEEQVDELRKVHRKMFGGMSDMQMKYCLLSCCIFDEKSRRLKEGVVNDDFFTVPN